MDHRHTALDGLRVGFAVHADGEAVVLRSLLARGYAGPIARLIGEVLDAHHRQEVTLARIDLSRPGWLERALEMRVQIRAHAMHEEAVVLPALRDRLSIGLYASLASQYASERLRAFGMLHPRLWRTDRDRRHRVSPCPDAAESAGSDHGTSL